MTLQETPLYKKYDEVITGLYILEDITLYENEEISNAIKILSKINIEDIAKDIYLYHEDDK